MDFWKITISIILVIVILFMIVNNRTEGYYDFSSDQTAYQQRQRSVFWDNSIPLEEDVSFSPDQLNKAFRNSDSGLPFNVDRNANYASLFKPGINYDLDAKIKACLNITNPNNLPGIPKSNDCGWWYIEDPTKISLSIFGNISGPNNPEKVQSTYPNGRWIWDKATAVKLEEIKECKRLTSCIAIDGKNASQSKTVSCGFCENLGHGIPIDTVTNQPKYSDDGTTCYSSFLKTTSSACTVTNNFTSTSASCDSSTGQDPYKYDANGNVTGLSPCAVQTRGAQGASGSNLGIPGLGGSGLGGAVTSGSGGIFGLTSTQVNSSNSQAVDSNCIPVNGKLTRGCLITLAKGVGFTEGGRLISIINGTKNISSVNDLPDIDKIAVTLLQNDGVAININVFGGGAITRTTAAQIYTDIFAKSTSGTTPKIREAAKYLSIGSTDFDICDFANTESGTFPLTCLQREFRKAGCQASGTSYPKATNANEYSSMNWGAIKQSFSGLYSSMNNAASYKAQDIAVQKCLGPTYYRPPIEICNENGVEYIIYLERLLPASADSNEAANNIFFGRVISKNGMFRSENTGIPITTDNNAYTILKSKASFSSFMFAPKLVVRTVKTPLTNESLTIAGRISLGDSTPWSLNNTIIPRDSYTIISTDKYGNNPLNYTDEFTLTVNLTKKQPNIISYKSKRLDVWGYTLVPSLPMTDATIKDYQLLQDSWRPVIGLDYFKERSDDMNNILTVIKSINFPYTEKSGKKSLNLTPTVPIVPNTYNFEYSGIYRPNIKTITFMINPTNPQASLYWPILELKNSLDNSNFQIILAKDNIASNSCYIAISMRGDKPFSTMSSGLGNVIPFNIWTHVTIFIDSSSQGSVNIKVTTTNTQSTLSNTATFSGDRTNQTLYNKTFILSTLCNMSVAWIHFYDYNLTQSEILRDMNYDNPDYIVPPLTNISPQTPNSKCNNIQYASTLTTKGEKITTPSAIAHSNAATCCAACANTNGCKAFEYIPDDNNKAGTYCNLYKSGSGYTALRSRELDGTTWKGKAASILE